MLSNGVSGTEDKQAFPPTTCPPLLHMTRCSWGRGHWTFSMRDWTQKGHAEAFSRQTSSCRVCAGYLWIVEGAVEAGVPGSQKVTGPWCHISALAFLCLSITSSASSTIQTSVPFTSLFQSYFLRNVFLCHLFQKFSPSYHYAFTLPNSCIRIFLLPFWRMVFSCHSSELQSAVKHPSACFFFPWILLGLFLVL